METRVAVISIIVEEGTSTDALNQRLHEASPYIIGRMGIPYRLSLIHIFKKMWIQYSIDSGGLQRRKKSSSCTGKTVGV